MGIAADIPVRPATAADLPRVRALLQSEALPIDDVTAAAPIEFLVAEARGDLVGAIGLERHGTSGLLRSLVVTPEFRGRGIGGLLVAALERRAAGSGIEHLALLTTTAEPFFLARGYAATSRDALGEAIRASNEFRTLCPASAACLARRLPSMY